MKRSSVLLKCLYALFLYACISVFALCASARGEKDENDARRIGDAIAYLMKYIEKSGEKIVYSRGLYAYFVSDIMDDDVVCPIGIEDRKLLLFDDFMCFDEGVLMGRVCREVIRRLRKSG